MWRYEVFFEIIYETLSRWCCSYPSLLKKLNAQVLQGGDWGNIGCWQNEVRRPRGQIWIRSKLENNNQLLCARAPCIISSKLSRVNCTNQKCLVTIVPLRLCVMFESKKLGHYSMKLSTAFHAHRWSILIQLPACLCVCNRKTVQQTSKFIWKQKCFF